MILYVLLGAVLFFIFQRLAVSSLLAIILLIIMVASFWWVTNSYNKSLQPVTSSILQKDTENRREIVATNYSVKRFGKLKYLEQNPELKSIALNLRFTRIFDKARFADLLLHMDKLQKVYMYILAGRYKPTQYVSIFNDLRASVSEILYSFYMVIPQGLKHTYGIQPYAELERGISSFNVATRTMINVLQSYAKSNGIHITNDYLTPFDKTRQNLLP